MSTGTWDLRKSPPLTLLRGGKAMASPFESQSSSFTYTPVVMSRPARERHILKWTLASWKRLPRRDTVHKNNLVTLGDRYVFLAAAVERSWQDKQCGPFFLSFWWVCMWRTLCVFTLRSSSEHMKRLLWALVALLQEAFRSHLMICRELLNWEWQANAFSFMVRFLDHWVGDKMGTDGGCILFSSTILKQKG